MTITRIQETKKGRFAVFADGEFLFSVHKDIFLGHQELAAGRQTNVGTLEAIRLEDEEYSCKEKALTLLEYSAHSAGRLSEKLARFYPAGTVERVVERLAGLGLLDDLDYGRRLAADLVNLRGYGPDRVRQELLRHRLDRETVEQVMEGLADRDQAGPLAALVRKRYLKKLKEPRGREKTAAALRRRGYAWEDIRDALATVEAEEGLEEEDTPL